MALIISFLLYCRISLICEKFASIMSVIPASFPSNSETSAQRAAPKIFSISGFIDLMTLLISSQLFVFCVIRVLWSFITVLTMIESWSTFVFSSSGKIWLSFRILPITQQSQTKELGSMVSICGISMTLDLCRSNRVAIVF